MFLISLELNPAKLWTLRRSIFIIGTAQVIITAALFTSLLIIIHFSWQAAVVGGIGAGDVINGNCFTNYA